ncbi:hypothetical protein RUND412_008273 [Rhizina undulata]
MYESYCACMVDTSGEYFARFFGLDITGEDYLACPGNIAAKTGNGGVDVLEIDSMHCQYYADLHYRNDEKLY